MRSIIYFYSIILFSVSFVLAENNVESSEEKISADLNNEKCVYRGDEYQLCESNHDCLNKGGEPLHRCKNGLSCCVDDYFTIHYHIGWRQLINRAMRNNRESNWTYDLAIFTWFRWTTSNNQHDNNYSDTVLYDIEAGDNTTVRSRSSGHDKDNFEVSGRLGDTHDHLITSYIDQSKPKSGQTEGKDRDDYHGCGKPRLRIKRIVGGKKSKFGHHPWQAALFKPTMKDRPFCGGSLLNDRWIITAAHCVDEKEKKTLRVRLGEFDVLSKEEELGYKKYRVIKKRVHPDYVNKGHRNDVALLKLNRKVNFDRHIIPICLPGTNLSVIGKEATVTGWGRRHHDEKKSHPSVLNEVDIEIISNDDCHARLLDAGHNKTIDDIYVCAGNRKRGRSGSCKGDSGGPLSVSVEGRSVLIGIVSWGFGCGKNRSPGMYANIKKYVPWILENID